MLQPALRQVIARRNWFGSSSAIPGSSNVPPFVPLPPTIRMACTTPHIAFVEQFAKHSLLYGTSVHGTPLPRSQLKLCFGPTPCSCNGTSSTLVVYAPPHPSSQPHHSPYSIYYAGLSPWPTIAIAPRNGTNQPLLSLAMLFPRFGTYLVADC